MENKEVSEAPVPFLVQPSPGSDCTLLLFGGIGGRVGMPPFEFLNITNGLAVDRLFIRDLAQSWYHGKLEGIGEGVDQIANFLKQELVARPTGRLVVCGNSMGAYAAILFGCLLCADVVLAFSPQTFIGRLRRIFSYDRRWYRQMKHVYRSPGREPRYYDLKRVVASRPSSGTAYHLYYNANNRLDRLHARRMGGLPGMTLHPCRGDSHRLVRQLRDDGQLRPIVQGAVIDGRPAEVR